jgi:hypothetical protein
MLKPPGVQTGKRRQWLIVKRAVPKALHLTISMMPPREHLRGA